jgi:hypothetical protein
MAAAKAEGLVFVPEEAAAETLGWQKMRNNLLRKKWVTAYEVEKYSLIFPKVTRKTIINWCKDLNNTNLVEGVDWYRDETSRNGKILILNATIKKLNNK